jgi:transposase
MVFEHGHEYESQWAGDPFDRREVRDDVCDDAPLVRQAEVDDGRRPRTTTADAERIKELEHENRELRRADEIVKAASAFFGGSSTRNRRGAERVHRRAPVVVRGRADLPRRRAASSATSRAYAATPTSRSPGRSGRRRAGRASRCGTERASDARVPALGAVHLELVGQQPGEVARRGRQRDRVRAELPVAPGRSG